jgi:hypothetical protein
MAETVTAPRFRLEPWVPCVLATLVAIVSVRPYAGSWNDGSRLATVESLVDRHTFAIDDSIFVRVPSETSPYPDDPLLADKGTQDKMWILGHYYSDKSPVPAVLLALFYAAVRALTGLTAASHPALFCYLLGLLSAGLPYVVAVVALDRLARVLRLSDHQRWLVTASFGFATVAPVYARQVNNHILLLGVAMVLMFQLVLFAREIAGWNRLLILGTLAGLAYTIDLGAGPPLLLCLLLLVAVRRRSALQVATVLLAALPWVLVHHALNYAVGGTWKPANANPEYFNWPGSPFPPQALTGAWNHQSFLELVSYALALLFGKHGFLTHNLPLCLLLTTFPLLWGLRHRVGPELGFALLWSVLTWALYAWASTNYSGQCCSIRWFVPLLAPGYFALAVLLCHVPRAAGELVVLSAWGALLAGFAWWYGPWIRHMVPSYWIILSAALGSWLLYRRLRANPERAGEGAARRRVGIVLSTRVAYEPDPASPLPAGGAGDRVGREQLPTV